MRSDSQLDPADAQAALHTVWASQDTARLRRAPSRLQYVALALMLGGQAARAGFEPPLLRLVVGLCLIAIALVFLILAMRRQRGWARPARRRPVVLIVLLMLFGVIAPGIAMAVAEYLDVELSWLPIPIGLAIAAMVLLVGEIELRARRPAGPPA